MSTKLEIKLLFEATPIFVYVKLNLSTTTASPNPSIPIPSAQPGGTWQAFMAWVPTGSAMQNPEPWSLWRNKKGANGQGKGGGLVGGNKNWT